MVWQLELQGLHADNQWVGSDRRGASLFWPLNRAAEYIVVPQSHRKEADPMKLAAETLSLVPGDLLVIHPMLAHAGHDEAWCAASGCLLL